MQIRKVVSSMAAIILLVLHGCAAVESLPVYKTDSSDWKSEKGGNPFVWQSNDETVKLYIVGTWPRWSLVGPLFFPIIPFYLPSSQITVIVASQPSNTAARIQNASVVADGVTLKFVERRLVERYKRPPFVTFRFETTQKFPTNIAVSVEGLPEAKFSVEKEWCYWSGDSEPKFIGCSEPARSTYRFP